MKLLGFCCSDMLMSLSGKNEFLAGQLALLTAGTAGRRVPARVIGSASRHGRLTASLGGALIRQGGGYNGKAVSKSSCSLEILLACCSSCSGRWGVAGRKSSS